MKVGLIMGSDSDIPVMKKALDILDEFGVGYDVMIASAHRTPDVCLLYTSPSPRDS